jgi:peroxiredoxin Q/BCP
MLRNKTPAPDFSLLDEGGTRCDLAQLRAGKLLTVFFFRGAFCPTARRDLMGYSNIYERLRAMGGDLVAVSVDEPSTLKQLKENLQLPFRLLSDADFSVSRAYGVYASDETGEGPQPHGEPAVFLLDIDGKIAYSQLQSGPKGHASAAELALVVFYMERNNGRYWD